MRRMALPRVFSRNSASLQANSSTSVARSRPCRTREVLLGGGTREFVPRTHQLAVVATVDAIADGAAQLERNRAGELDGEIGNAAPRVQAIGGDDGAGGAGRQAGAAEFRNAPCSAHRRAARDPGRSRRGRNTSPALAIDQIGVLADPAEAGIARQRLLEDRRAVDECAVAKRSDPLGDAVAELLQTVAHELVIVAAQRVARHVGDACRRRARARASAASRRPVIHARADAADRAREEFRRPRALAAVPRHVAHLAVEARAQPIEEMRLVRRKVDVRDADAGKSELASPQRWMSAEQGGGIEWRRARVIGGFGRPHAGKATRSRPIMVNIPALPDGPRDRMAVSDLELALPDAAATEALGAALARTFPGAERASAGAVSRGRTGRGQDHLRARACCAPAASSGLIRSPTYTLVEDLPARRAHPPLTCVHVDLYRLEGAGRSGGARLARLPDAPDCLLLGRVAARKARARCRRPISRCRLRMRRERTARAPAVRGTARGERVAAITCEHDTRLATYLSNLT